MLRDEHVNREKEDKDSCRSHKYSLSSTRKPTAATNTFFPGNMRFKEAVLVLTGIFPLQLCLYVGLKRFAGWITSQIFNFTNLSFCCISKFVVCYIHALPAIKLPVVALQRRHVLNEKQMRRLEKGFACFRQPSVTKCFSSQGRRQWAGRVAHNKPL